LRSLSRDIENFPMSVTDVECQVIPFWTGYNSSLSEYRPEYSVVSYAPIVDAKPKRFGIPHTFGFENVRHDVCEEASLVI
jgi:hypothetical protein